MEKAIITTKLTFRKYAQKGKYQLETLDGNANSDARLAAKLERGDLFAAQCPSREVLKHVTSRWGVLVLVALLAGTHRFSGLRRKVNGISEKMLAQTLQWLESDGFIERIAYPVVPPHVEYTLTPLGQEIGKQVEALADWIEGNLPAILAAQQLRSGA